MKAFVGLVMLMSINNRNAYESYWSEWKLLQNPEFKKVMTRDRFLSILTFLHFSDNENPTADKLFKVCGLWIFWSLNGREPSIPIGMYAWMRA
jgi:hypothetical protein